MQITCLPSFGYDLHLDQCSCGPLDALKDVTREGFHPCLMDQELLNKNAETQ